MLSNLVHRNKKANAIHEGKWNGRSGKSEAGETPEECITRDVQDEKLTSLNLWGSDHICFPWITEGKFFSAKFEYDEDKMRAYNVVFHSYG